MSNGKVSKWAWSSVFFGILAALLLLFSGYGYQWGWWGLGTAFTWLIPASAVAGLISFTLALFFGFARWNHPRKRGAGWAAIGIALSIAVMGTVGYWFNETQKYPPIHDVSTDIENPPEFRAIVQLRADAPNDTTYGGEENADLQRRYYPDVQTIYMDMEYDEVFDRALEAAKRRPWEEIVTSDRQAGLIEAYDKLPWFGFIDDVVIRIDTADTSGHYKIDVRSVSRLSRGDIGVNAQRIRDYLSQIQKL